MSNLPESENDPLGLEGVDREIRIEKLRREIEEVAGGEMICGKSADCDPEIEEAFLEHVLALETHGLVCPFETLIKEGLELPPSENLEDAALTEKLWELIRELANRCLFLHCTDHLS